MDRPSVPFPLGQFLMPVLRQIGRIPERAAIRLMTGAQQISSQVHTVFVSAGWLPRTEVVEMSPMRRRMEIPSFKKGDETSWEFGITCESGDGGRPIQGFNLHQAPLLLISFPESSFLSS